MTAIAKFLKHPFSFRYAITLFFFKVCKSNLQFLSFIALKKKKKKPKTKKQPFSYLQGLILLEPLCFHGLGIFFSPFGWACSWEHGIWGKKKTGKRKRLPKTAVALWRITTLPGSTRLGRAPLAAWGFW